MRLQKYLAQAGVASRRRAEELIRRGEVRVNGEPVDQLGTQVDAENDRVEVQGRRVRPAAPMYRLLLKPRGCLSTLSAPDGEKKKRAGAGPTEARPTLDRFVPDREVGWQVVAPLDFPAEGVVLLTTDGGLAQVLGRGGGKVAMTYHIKYQGTVGDEEVGKLLRGWRWNRRPVKPESAVALATTGKNTWVEVVVRETRPRVLKASGEAIRKSVLKISRVKLGPLSFEGLTMGQSRDLSRAEVNALRRAAGLL
jgi:23S rRNA pseudouridine2605 synthase